jgi:hypothetical protein
VGSTDGSARSPAQQVLVVFVQAMTLVPGKPDFDGAGIRHLLCTLALTHFHTVQTKFSDHPALHTLHNRSGELWSSLVALAAFFEEQGGITGLLEATAAAARTDEQISEGKALSERAERRSCRRSNE